jgi:hypothetical protein
MSIAAHCNVLLIRRKHDDTTSGTADKAYYICNTMLCSTRSCEITLGLRGCANVVQVLLLTALYVISKHLTTMHAKHYTM